MKYLYRFVFDPGAGPLKVIESNSRDEFVLAMAELGHQAGPECQRRGLREELQGQPTFRGEVHGPVYDGQQTGVPVIRYEDKSANDILSR